MAAMMTGRLRRPISPTWASDSRKPSSTMPSRSSVVSAKRAPVWIAADGVVRLAHSRPSRMASVMPEIGLRGSPSSPVPIQFASQCAPMASRIARLSPGASSRSLVIR
jgi:hypothetical protein